MKLIYTAGPITADTPGDRKKNCERAWNYAHRIWKMGAGVICPQYNTYFMDDVNIGYEMFMQADYAMIKRACDGVFMLPKWEDSKGACMERDLAFAEEIPVFYFNKMHELEEFIKNFVTLKEEQEDAVHSA